MINKVQNKRCICLVPDGAAIMLKHKSTKQDLTPLRIQKMIALIQMKFPDVLAVYLFGSVCRGDAIAGSDVDMAILAQGRLPVLDVWLLAQALAKHAGVHVDLIDLLSASTVMRMQVIGQGHRLACMDEDACSVFEDYVFVDYARLNEERGDILQDIQQRGCVYG